jgi:hypothetical protein
MGNILVKISQNLNLKSLNAPMSESAEAMLKAGDLRTYETGLRANPDISVILNANDFLLTDEDLIWLRFTFDPNQLTRRSGHPTPNQNQG